MNNPLPQELQRRWGYLQFVRQRGSAEFSAECPKCSDSGHYGNDAPDRFRMFPSEPGHNARGFCRQCGYFSWADEDTPEYKPTREQMEAANRERLRLYELENRRIKEKIRRIASSDFWKHWHSDMSDGQRELWHKEGIVDWAIEEYKLGFCQDHIAFHDGAEWHTPTLTIPHWGSGWELVNIQHRLLNPPEPGDKYRQTAGLPAAMFLTEPDKELKGAALVVEGAKKAIVTMLHIGGKDLRVVGLPGKSPSGEMLSQLDKCEPVYLCLDPDAYVPTRTKDGKPVKPAVNRIVERVGRERARIVKLPCKPDDLLTKYGGTAADLMAYLKIASRPN